MKLSTKGRFLVFFLSSPNVNGKTLTNHRNIYDGDFFESSKFDIIEIRVQCPTDIGIVKTVVISLRTYQSNT